MDLETYNKKRDFSQTPEPAGAYEKSEGALRFVIQRHQASSLHYDLRLELKGVLKSWAVPKGPSMNPRDKRLAIHTEDHPIKYLNFQGRIPKGNYGAGKMEIWDQGTYQSTGGKGEGELIKQYENGSLKLDFMGGKIKGAFALVRIKAGKDANQWLLIKKGDDFSTDLGYDAQDLMPLARPESVSSKQKKSKSLRELKLGQLIRPMLANKANQVKNEKGWIYELKWDGYRALCNIDNGKVNLYSRNGISFNHKFSELHHNLQAVPYDAILDGEIVSLDPKGKPVFQNLQNYQQHKQGELRYYVFDVLFLNGHNTMTLPLVQRKSLIRAIIQDIPKVYYCEHIDAMGQVFYDKAIQAGMEGIIAKKADSEYVPGLRSAKWLKIKGHQSQEALICGYTESLDAQFFGSLILGIMRDDKLQYIGNCGTGFKTQTRKDLFKRFGPLTIDKSPFPEKINLKGRQAIWLSPKLICELRFLEWTPSGTLRHPSFKGLRFDKIPSEIRKEEVTKIPAQPTRTTRGEFLDIDGVQVPISNLEKVYWPQENYSKYDLIDYYLQVSELILPYLVDRPENLHRHPNGIKAAGFYQKDTAGIFPDWLQTISLHSGSGGREIRYALCQNQASLIYLANLGCIEINPWSSRISNLKNPDFTVIDIDPSAKNTFKQVIEVALAAKQVLDSAKVQGFVKTSGSSGIHIYLPLGAAYSYGQGRDFAQILCYLIHDMLPKLTSMERNVKKRGEKIYLDFLQNRRGQTLAAPYCVRPKPGATVSTPLAWEELKPGLDMRDFTIKTIPSRLEDKPDLFGGVLGSGINISKALENLA